MKKDHLRFAETKQVTLSPKYQVVIPKRVREQMKLEPGKKFMVIPYEGRIEFIPLEDIRSMRGILKGIDTTIEREPDRI